jgi:hypothetical protein
MKRMWRAVDNQKATDTDEEEKKILPAFSNWQKQKHNSVMKFL